MMATTKRETPEPAAEARNVADRLKAEGKQKLERGKASAADQIQGVAGALNRAGAELNRTQPTLAAYASQIADSIGRFGNRLRDSSLEDIARDVQQAARRNPALFLAGGFALGMVLSRLIKASSQQEPIEASGYEYSGASSGVGPTDRPTTLHSEAQPGPDVPTLDITETYGAGAQSQRGPSTRPTGG